MQRQSTTYGHRKFAYATLQSYSHQVYSVRRKGHAMKCIGHMYQTRWHDPVGELPAGTPVGCSTNCRFRVPTLDHPPSLTRFFNAHKHRRPPRTGIRPHIINTAHTLKAADTMSNCVCSGAVYAAFLVNQHQMSGALPTTRGYCHSSNSFKHFLLPLLNASGNHQNEFTERNPQKSWDPPQRESHRRK